MIVGLTGILEGQLADAVFIRVGGVTLRVMVPTGVSSRLPAVGQQIRLHTHLLVREDLLALYGFGSDDELALFETLLTVSGVGPRVALGMLSGMPADALRLAIASGNVQALTTLPGVGKKLAARIVLELKGKIDVAAVASDSLASGASDAELLAALTGLGYSPADAQSAIRTVPGDPNLPLEERIVLALRHFSR